MNFFQTVRESLGFTQEVMAGLLGIQISAYRMAESSNRKLPSEALARLTWMFNTVQSLPETDASPYELQDIKTVLHKTRKKKLKLDKDLEELATKWKQSQNRLAFQPLFQEQFPPENHIAETGYLTAQVHFAQYFLQSADPQEELQKKAMQVGLAAMLEFLEAESKKSR
jgi:transcriptional regulator with XRE-family HTH domain